MDQSKNLEEGEGISLKTLTLIFFISLFLLIGSFLLLNENSFGNIQGAVVFTDGAVVFTDNSKISIKDINNCNELDLKKEDIFLLNDFENVDIVDECKVESLGEEVQVSKTTSKEDGLCGKYLQIDYNILSCLKKEYLKIECNQKIELKDYKYINFLVKRTGPDIWIRSGFFDANNSTYSTALSPKLNKDGWSLISIPSTDLHDPQSLEKKTIKEDISGYFFGIGILDIGECKEKEATLSIDTVYLSKG